MRIRSKSKIDFNEIILESDKKILPELHHINFITKLFFRTLPIRIKHIEKKAIFHSSYYRYTKNKNVKNIITVYDFTHEYYLRGFSSIVYRIQKKRAIKNAAGIICISENTKKDLLYFYPKLNTDIVKVIYLAASEDYFPITGIDITKTNYSSLKEKKILSFIGKRTNYKNFDLAIKVINKLPKDYHLLIIGGDTLDNNELKKLSCISGRYSYQRPNNSQEINVVYNISFCYLYLTNYEGFGLPILEAMKAGCPVICQNNSSIPEVYGDVDNLVRNTNDVDEICSKIVKLEEKNFRHKLIEQGFLNEKRFNWNNTFKQTIEFYRQINALT